MVGFSKTLARYRVSEWHTMYIDYETLKTYVNETKRKREEIMTCLLYTSPSPRD